MKNITIPYKLIHEADILSKETGMDFRLCLEMLYRSKEGGGNEVITLSHSEDSPG